MTKEQEAVLKVEGQSSVLNTDPPSLYFGRCSFLELGLSSYAGRAAELVSCAGADTSEEREVSLGRQ